MAISTLNRPWYQNTAFKVGTAIAALVLLVSFVFFGGALDNLLKFFGIKAATPEITVGGDNPSAGFGFFDPDPNDSNNRHSADPANAYTIDAQGNLTLNH